MKNKLSKKEEQQINKILEEKKKIDINEWAELHGAYQDEETGEWNI